MKKTWSEEELVECWTLLPDELALLTQTSGENRLGFALLGVDIAKLSPGAR